MRPSSITENRHPGEPPVAFVQRIAEEKARTIACETEDIVLGADTVVSLEDEVFGKPIDDEDARHMLRRLSGREHSVYTGICILYNGRCIADVARTGVQFTELSDKEVEEYVRTGESRDKAGAYAIQGLASKFVSSITGCYHNVVGLPVSLVYRYLKAL